MITKGRKRIFTDKEVNRENIINILNESLSIHNENVSESKKLIDIYLGDQEILKRQETDMSNINNKVVLNYAFSSERDIIGYTFGKDVEIIPSSGKHRRDIKKILDIMEYENTTTVDLEAALMTGITGLGYYYTLPSKEIRSDYMPDIPIQLHAADIFKTFVVRSNDIGNPVVLSVSYRSDKKYTYFTCYTDNLIYKIKSLGVNMVSSLNYEIKVEENVLGLNPIVPIENNCFLLGDFEVCITLFNAINTIASDSVDDVENVIKSLLVLLGAELEEEEVPKVKKNRILQLLGTPGVNLDAKFIYQQLDAQGIKDLREYFEEAYKIILGIPDRKTRGGGGGDTGDAVELRDGWADIEIVARLKEQYLKIAKKKQLAIVIKILQLLGYISKNVKLQDLTVKYPRNKNNNIVSKAQAFSTLHGTKALALEDELAITNLTTDITETAERGEHYWNSKGIETDNNGESTDNNIIQNTEKNVDNKNSQEVDIQNKEE